uniref:Uncharacterized protein n=1 Tax=Macrostomum lignano TaxID=282301 RepID=A0A1I8FDC4_9PLAT
MELQPRPQ